MSLIPSNSLSGWSSFIGGLLLVAALSGWGYLEYNYHVDYIGIYEVLKDELLGHNQNMTCLDVGAEWVNIPRCREELLGEVVGE